MTIVKFQEFKTEVNKKYSMIDRFVLKSGEEFYIEPSFYTQLEYVKDHFRDKYDEIIDEIIDTVKRNKKVVFTGNYDNPIVNEDEFVYREIDDVLARLKLYFDNKSNPDSDWKD